MQVLVVGFDHLSFSGEVLVELARLREAGIVRLVDLLLVTRGEDGTFRTLDPPAAAGTGLGGLAAELLGAPDADGAGVAAETVAGDPIHGDWSLADAVPVGSTAAVALLEHVWAGPLSAAIGRAGGTPLEEAWLAPEDRELLDALVARRAAETRPDGE